MIKDNDAEVNGRQGISLLFGFTLIKTRELDALRAAAKRPPDGLRSAEPDERDQDGTATEAPAGVVRELIRMADRLPDAFPPSAPGDPGGTDAVAQWLTARVRAMLATCDVSRIEDNGLVDASRHEVVGTRTAPTADLAQQIAETVRPGYEWHGKLMRPQQVIAYVPGRGKTREPRDEAS